MSPRRRPSCPRSIRVFGLEPDAFMYLFLRTAVTAQSGCGGGMLPNSASSGHRAGVLSTASTGLAVIAKVELHPVCNRRILQVNEQILHPHPPAGLITPVGRFVEHKVSIVFRRVSSWRTKSMREFRVSRHGVSSVAPRSLWRSRMMGVCGRSTAKAVAAPWKSRAKHPECGSRCMARCRCTVPG